MTPRRSGVDYAETLTTRPSSRPTVTGVIPVPRPGSPWWPHPADVALATALAAASIVGTALVAQPDDRPWWPGGAALIVAAATALVWRHGAPVPVLGATLLTVAPYYWMGYPDGPASLMVAVAMYTVASRLSWPRSVGIGLALFVVWVGLERVISADYGVAAPD